MRVWVVIALYFLPVLVWGQESEVHHGKLEEYLYKYLATDNQANVSIRQFEKYLDRLETRKLSVNNDIEFLHHLFLKTHNKFLREYRDYVPFGNLMVKGQYNCLTGTALYALLLDHFKYDYKVIETNYHIFLIVNLNGTQVLLESTDPADGFITDEKVVKEKLSIYKEIRPHIASKHKSYFQFSFELFNTVGLDQLTGLLYYNLAVNAFNQKKLAESIQFLDKAMTCYKSPRTEEFSKIILTALMESNLKSSIKESYARKINSLF